jgi:ribosomal protein S27E
MQYDDQYNPITAWKCNKCGRVLTTQGGGRAAQAAVQICGARAAGTDIDF